jgi:transcriptional regulator with GAF, ATPase, and Fis domain
MPPGDYPISRHESNNPSFVAENPSNKLAKPLEKFQSLLLNAWREACRHIELDESTATIAKMVAQTMPLETLLVRRFDQDLRSVETLAVGQAADHPFHASPRTIATPAKWTRLLQWASGDQLIHCPATRRSGDINLLLPEGCEGEVLAGPLTNREGPIGALVFVAEYSRAFQPEHLELARLLLEPFSVAMENHRRLHELSSLREAAESERWRGLRPENGDGAGQPRRNFECARSDPRRNGHWKGSGFPRDPSPLGEVKRPLHSSELRCDPARTHRLTIVRARTGQLYRGRRCATGMV